MDWLGLLIFAGFSILLLTIILNICGTNPCEGFTSRGPAILPAVQSQVKSDVPYLPNAPITELPDMPRPTYDPAYPRTLIPQILELKYAMDDFYERELPYVSASDASVQLPISQFKGNYQTVKAELLFLSANEYSPPQLKVRDIDEMGKNLRFLQKEARKVVPTEGFTSSSSASPSASSSSSSSSSPSASRSSSSSPSASSSSSSSSSPSASSSPSSNKNPISFIELQTLSLKLSVEIARLTATGSTDPILKSRSNIYTNIKNTVDSLIAQVNNKTLDTTQIPIAKGDYDTFLPALGSDSAGPGGILFNSGYSSLSSLFNSYQVGDLSGSKLAETLFNTYADTLVNGLSYSFNLSYTSPNETTKEVAKALYRGEFQDTIDDFTDGFTDTATTQCQKDLSACQKACGDPTSSGYDMCFDKCSSIFTTCSQAAVISGTYPGSTYPGSTSKGTNNSSWMDTVYAAPDTTNTRSDVSSPTYKGGFNWKEKAKQLYSALQRMSLDPGDFGALAPGTQVSPDYSWRGNARMVCTRAATHSDPALPEQIGCPPVNWPGWRS